MFKDQEWAFAFELESTCLFAHSYFEKIYNSAQMLKRMVFFFNRLFFEISFWAEVIFL